MQLDHVAIAVKSVDTAAARICALLDYRRRTSKVTNRQQGVNVLFLEKSGSVDLKLIEPTDEESPLWRTLAKGEGLHHLCFKAADVRAACAELGAKGARVLSAPEPGEAFDGHLIAFLYLGVGLNVEIIDTDHRRALLPSRPEGSPTQDA